MSAETGQPSGPGIIQILLDWARRAQLERRLAILFIVLALCSGTITLGVMTDHLPIAGDPQTILLLLVGDLVFLLGLSALIARRLVLLWAERKRGRAGALLHGRMVALFSFVAVTPTIFVAVFSVVLFDFGLKTWFSEKVGTAINNSLAVAEAYTEEHIQALSNDALAISQVLNRSGAALIYSPGLLRQVLAQEAQRRDLTEAAVYDGSGYLLARATNFLLAFNPDIPDWALERARQGDIAILKSENDDRVRALVRLDLHNETFLYVGRLIDPRVLGHLDRTRGAVQLYAELEGKSSGVQIAFGAIFAVVSLMLLLAAVWVGLTFANHLAVPIANLISAAGRVAGGDLSARVAERNTQDEIASLSRAFNRMTGELQSQQGELLSANRELDIRNQFIEAVLGGISAGVIGLDAEGKVTLPNRAACEFLETDEAAMRGRPLSDLLPDSQDMLVAARRRPNRRQQKNIGYLRKDGTARSLHCRIVAEEGPDGLFGYVVTFDDISELHAAQRKAAWSDIARRIAHEIKNPLTPIQLSAERLKRKYLGQITEERETFRLCTDTIISHVDDIGRMVDEFSSFARMPLPVMSEESLRQLVEQAVFLQQSGHPEIAFVTDLPDDPMVIPCDGQQIARALTNLLQNASEAIDGREAAEDETLPKGRIEVTLKREAKRISVTIGDNGRGLPKTDRHRLTEPYVTTRDRGTGLGLAIVKKILEDHDGELALEDRTGGGALARVTFLGGGQAADEAGEKSGAAKAAE